jgi:hypothetical protein
VGGRTIGTYDFHGGIDVLCISHYKTDPDTGGMLFFAAAGPVVTWYRADVKTAEISGSRCRTSVTARAARPSTTSAATQNSELTPGDLGEHLHHPPHRPSTSLISQWLGGLSRPTRGSQAKKALAGTEEWSRMPGMLERIKQFARSPQGRRTVEQARRAAADPRRRAQAKSLLSKLRGRR